MKQIRCLAIDDEPMALKKLETYIAKIPFLEPVGFCESPYEAIPILADNRIDAIFIDINMPDLNGMAFLDTMPSRPMIVFTTAYSEYAVDSYRYSAVDYLLKPFDFTDFQRAVNKLYIASSASSSDVSQTMDDSLYVKVDYRYVNIRISDIMYLKGMNEYVQIFPLEGKPLAAHTSMKKMLDRLPPHFVQVHRSFIVNMRMIKEIERMRIMMPDGIYITVTDNYKQPFMNYIAAHSLIK